MRLTSFAFIIVALWLAGFLSCKSNKGDSLTIACSANVQYAVKDICDTFSIIHKVKVKERGLKDNDHSKNNPTSYGFTVNN